MSITPYSLFTAVLWSSAFILLLYFFRKNTRLLALTGVTPLLFLILGTALRCLFPIEFLHFTNVVGLEGLVAGLFRALRAPLGQLPLQVWEVLLLVWAAGSLGLAARTGFGAWKFHKKLRSYEPLEDSRIERLAQQAARELDMPAPLLIQTLRADTPVIAGLLRPVILLPCYHYTDEEYRYVFLHELCHWKNHDMWVKLFVEVFCILFWWNPLVYLLKKDLARALELKCDGAVLKHAGAQAALDYQEVLVKTLVSSHKQKNKGFSATGKWRHWPWQALWPCCLFALTRWWCSPPIIPPWRKLQRASTLPLPRGTAGLPRRATGTTSSTARGRSPYRSATRPPASCWTRAFPCASERIREKKKEP